MLCATLFRYGETILVLRIVALQIRIADLDVFGDRRHIQYDYFNIGVFRNRELGFMRLVKSVQLFVRHRNLAAISSIIEEQMLDFTFLFKQIEDTPGNGCRFNCTVFNRRRQLLDSHILTDHGEMHIGVKTLRRKRFLVTGFIQFAIRPDQPRNFANALQNDLFRYGKIFLVDCFKQNTLDDQVLQNIPFEFGRLDPFVIEWLAGSGSALAETFRLFALGIVPFLLCNGFSGDLGNGITITKTFEPLDTDKNKGRNDENQKNDLSQTFVVAYKLKHGGLCPFKKMRLK